MSNARVRASVELRAEPDLAARIVEALGAGKPVEVLEDQGLWLKVQISNTGHKIPGWVPREALAFPPTEELFPAVKTETGETISTISHTIKASALDAWKTTAHEDLEWVPKNIWGNVDISERTRFKNKVKSVLDAHQAEWDAWLADIEQNGRRDEAGIEEWFATLQGGSDVWPVRSETINQDPADRDPKLGWAHPNDIMRWTGKVKRNENDPKYPLWYEVILYKSGRMMKGWFKGNIVDPYIFPTPENDPANEANADKQFDLSRPILRHPADKEIEDTITARRGARQYIDVKEALGKTKIHHNLCGEFCVAALAGRDIIPFLKEWIKAYSQADIRIKNILTDPVRLLNSDSGTGQPDVEFMLDMCGISHREYRYTPSISPITSLRLKREINEGGAVFWGVSIFKAGGKLSGKSTSNTTRHWIVLEDVIPVGNSGWVRIYNPFMNREEVYNYDYFIESVGQFGLGLRVEGWKRNRPNVGVVDPIDIIV